MGYHCDRCEHEWLPRTSGIDPLTCPKCKSAAWNQPKKASPALPYETFRDAIEAALLNAGTPLTWTEIRTTAKLPQAFPNNRWVRQLESHIGLQRRRDSHGIIQWSLGERAGAKA